MRNRLLYAGFGALATLFGMALAHLVASVTNPSASPVLAVGSQVIDLTPTPLKEFAIRQFGTADKMVLLGSVVIGVLVFAAIAGLLTLKRFAYGAGLLVLLVGVAAFAALNRPAAGATDVLPQLAAAVGGVAALWWLDRSARRSRSAAASSATPVATDPAATPATTGSAETLDSSRPSGTEKRGSSRRGVLIATGTLAVAATVLGGAGRLITSIRTRPSAIDLPAPAKPAPPLPEGISGRYDVTPFRIANEDFYKVDTRLDLPVIDVDSWTLTIDGDVEREVTFTFAEIAAMPLIERDITLTCVSNDVGGPYVGGARWLGVRLTDLLEQAGVGTTADQILSTDVDGMTISTPLALATDGRDAMLAIGMNGEALPRAHGFPARMVVPGLYGFVSATKWVTRMTLTTYAEQQAYWTKKDWATDAPIKISSRIDTPKPLSTIEAGKTFIGGIAWAQADGGVAKVEVRIDGGPWREAELGPDGGNVYWRQWYFPWDATESGQHFVAVRATAGNGEVQTAARATTFPDGSSGIQEIAVRVS